MSSNHESSSRWDRLGVWASAACAVHCLVAPALFIAVPAFASVWAHPASHAVIATLVLPLAVTVLTRGYRVHGGKLVAGAAAVGIACIAVGCVLPYLGPEAQAAGTEACVSCCPQAVVDEAGETSIEMPPASIATLAGSFFLVAAHIGNLVRCRGCKA